MTGSLSDFISPLIGLAIACFVAWMLPPQPDLVYPVIGALGVWFGFVVQYNCDH